MNDPVESKETMVKQEPRMTIDRKESVKGDVSWNFSVLAPLDPNKDADLKDRIANARIYAIKKDAIIKAALPPKEEAPKK